MIRNRDRIWATTLQLLELNQSVTATEVLESIEQDAPAIRTIRDTLDSMEKLGIIASEGGAGRAPRKFYFPELGSDPSIPGYSPRSSGKSTVMPYPGSKTNLANWIIDHMPAHDCYVEVFGGGASVLVSKPKSKYEVYNDLDDDLVHFFRILREQPVELIEWLQTVPYSRSQYNSWVSEFYSGKRVNDDIERAGRFYSLRWMQFAGVYSEKNGFKVRARRSPARSFNNARSRLMSFADRFAEVIIEHQNYASILERYDDSSIDVLFYLDPPYSGSEEQYGIKFDRDYFINKLNEVGSNWMLSCLEVPSGLETTAIVTRENRHRMKQGTDRVTEKLACSFDPDNCSDFKDSFC